MRHLIAAGLLLAFGGASQAQDLALGDSLALGYGQASGLPLRARVGASSCQILRWVPSYRLNFVLISAGTNDVPGRCVAAIRARIHADVVEWVIPVNGSRETVLAVAHRYGDRELFYVPGRNWPHPNRYRNIR